MSRNRKPLAISSKPDPEPEPAATIGITPPPFTCANGHNVQISQVEWNHLADKGKRAACQICGAEVHPRK